MNYNHFYFTWNGLSAQLAFLEADKGVCSSGSWINPSKCSNKLLIKITRLNLIIFNRNKRFMLRR